MTKPNPLARYARAIMKIKEADFQVTLIELLQWHGYKVCEFRKARIMKGGVDTYRTPFGADGVGFPDLFVVHPESDNTFAVECKSDSGKLSPEQEDWIDWLRKCGIRTFVWKPQDWESLEEIVKELAIKEII